MRLTTKITATVLLITGMVLVSCTGTRHISAEAFEREYQNSKIVHSAQSYEVLGVKDGKAYLSHTRIGPFGGARRAKVYVTDLTDLPAKTQQELKAK